MKQQYVAGKRILLTTGPWFVEKGDILTFANGILTIYRAQKIVKTMGFTQGGLNALARSKMVANYFPVEPARPAPVSMRTPSPQSILSLPVIDPAAVVDSPQGLGLHVRSAPPTKPTKPAPVDTAEPVLEDLVKAIGLGILVRPGWDTKRLKRAISQAEAKQEKERLAHPEIYELTAVPERMEHDAV